MNFLFLGNDRIKIWMEIVNLGGKERYGLKCCFFFFGYWMFCLLYFVFCFLEDWLYKVGLVCGFVGYYRVWWLWRYMIMLLLFLLMVFCFYMFYFISGGFVWWSLGEVELGCFGRGGEGMEKVLVVVDVVCYYL